jgi:hypothetical protein
MYRRQLYFLKQRLTGLLVLTLAGLSVMVLNGDPTLALILTPAWATLLFSKKMVLTDDYYFEVKEQEKNGGKL